MVNNGHLSYLGNKSISVTLSKVFENRFYIDLFRDNSANYLNKESILLKLSHELDLPLTCSNDVFFLIRIFMKHMNVLIVYPKELL